MFTKDKIWMMGSTACIALVAVGAYYWGHHNIGAAYADVPVSPQAIASADGAPSVPNLCVLSQNAVYANAKIGVAATSRYRDLTTGLKDQLTPQQQSIQDDAKKLETEKAALPGAEYQRRTEALAVRIRALQLANGQDTKDLEATRQKALRQIAAYAQPIIAEAYKARHCGALFSRDAMLVGNPGMDLTPTVVAGLDSKVTTISFDLEKAPPATVGQAAR